MLEILIILLILILVKTSVVYNKPSEAFNVSTSGIGSTPYLYNKRVESPFQIGQVHHPDYNYPECGRKYPYYNHFFHPYNSTIYY